MHAFLFPGQGSQYRGMGRDLFDAVPEFTRIEDTLDRLLGYSIRDMCLNDRESRLKDTRYTQPCLFVVNALHYFEAVKAHGHPQAVAGHSLGEYDALLAAGAFDLMTGVRLVAARGALMAEAAGGGMAAVVGVPSDDVKRILREEALASLDIANYNAPLQTVVAGPLAAIEQAAAACQRRGASYIRLPVSAAFHSRYMRPVADRLAELLEPVQFSPLRLPVISNVTGQFYPDRATGATIRSFLVQQITRPVRWMDGVRHLRRHGMSSLTEVGPGNVLTRLCQHIEQQVA